VKLDLTDLLDLAGSLLIVAALAVFVAPYSLAGALGVAGAGLIAVSWVIDNPLAPLAAAYARRAQLRRAQRKEVSS